MREYAKIAPRFYAGEVCRTLRRVDPSGKALLVWLYLQSSPHSNMLGLYYQPIPFIGFELGIGEQDALKGLQTCIELRLCTYDAETFMVWVFDMASEQIAPSLKPNDLRCKGIQSDYDNLPDNPFLGPWFDRYAQAFNMVRRREGTRELSLFGEGPYQAPTKPGAGAGAGALEPLRRSQIARALPNPGETLQAGQGLTPDLGFGDAPAARTAAPTSPPCAPPPPRKPRQPPEAAPAPHGVAAAPPPRPEAAPPADPPPEAAGHEPTVAGRFCKAMRAAGLQQTNPGDPRFKALIDQGATLDEFVGLVAEALSKGINAPWPWILRTLEARRAEAAAIALAPPTPKPGEPSGRMPVYVPPPAMSPEERAAADAKRREVMARHGRAA